MYVDGVSFQIYVDQFWLESIEVMLFCTTMNFKVSSDWSKPDREAVNWYRVCVRSVDCTRVLTLQKQATGPTNRATQRLCMKSCFLCFKVFLLEHALTLWHCKHWHKLAAMHSIAIRTFPWRCRCCSLGTQSPAPRQRGRRMWHEDQEFGQMGL